MVRIILIALLFLPATLLAQVKKPQNLPGYDEKLIHFGFTIGGSTQDFNFKRNIADNIYANSTNPINSFGLQVTIISDLRLTDYATLRFLPGLALGQANISFYDMEIPDDLKILGSQDFELAALQFPLQLKVRSLRLNNYRPYFIGGLNYMYDMTGVKQGDSDILIELKRGNLIFEVGYGIDWYLQYFKFAPELKLGIGLIDLVDRASNKGLPDYVNSLDRISTYYVMLNFHFE